MSEPVLRMTGCRLAGPEERPTVSIPFNEVLTLRERLNTARGLILALLNCPAWMRDHSVEEAEAFLEGKAVT